MAEDSLVDYYDCYEFSEYILGIVKLQAVIRGWLVRRRLADIQELYQDIVRDLDGDGFLATWQSGPMSYPVVSKSKHKTLNIKTDRTRKTQEEAQTTRHINKIFENKKLVPIKGRVLDPHLVVNDTNISLSRSQPCLVGVQHSVETQTVSGELEIKSHTESSPTESCPLSSDILQQTSQYTVGHNDVMMKCVSIQTDFCDSVKPQNCLNKELKVTPHKCVQDVQTSPLNVSPQIHTTNTIHDFPKTSPEITDAERLSTAILDGQSTTQPVRSEYVEGSKPDIDVILQEEEIISFPAHDDVRSLDTTERAGKDVTGSKDGSDDSPIIEHVNSRKETELLESLPEDKAELEQLQKTLAMELLWVQQAIVSRKHYLRLRQEIQ